MSGRERPDRRDRVLGCFLGGAVGDALGATVAPFRLAEIRRRHGPAGCRRVPAEGATITDETQLALFCAEGLAAAGDDLRSGYLTRLAPHLHAAYLRWLLTQTRRQPPDPLPGPAPLRCGPLVGRAELYADRSPSRSTVGALLAGRRGTLATAVNDARDAGALARVAPVGLVEGLDPFTTGAEAAAITHGHPTAYLAAGLVALLVAGTAAGRPLAEVAEDGLEVLARYPRRDDVAWGAERALEVAAREPQPSAETVEWLLGRGDAADVVSVALYAALTACSFAAGVRTAINHSGDSAATGAVAGALLGAAAGVSAVPPSWARGVAEVPLVLEVARDFAALVGGPDPRSDPAGAAGAAGAAGTGR